MMEVIRLQRDTIEAHKKSAGSIEPNIKELSCCKVRF